MRTVVVLVCAGTEWRVVREAYARSTVGVTRGLEYFDTTEVAESDRRLNAADVIFMHTGWGKIAAASAAQHAIDRFVPDVVINIGTCGGIASEVERGDVILCTRTVVYDIIEQIGNQEESIAQYTTDLDVSMFDAVLPKARRATLVSADRDLVAAELLDLKHRYGAIAGDWESGAIAWVAERNGVPCLILRGVSDVVGEGGGDAYDGNAQVFTEGTEIVMRTLLEILPGVIRTAT